MANMKEHINAILNPDKEIYTLQPPLPTKLTVELNETCNSTCVFCTFHSSCDPRKYEYGVMKPEFAKKLLTEAYESGIGMQEVALFATGEPFLYTHLAEVVAHAKGLGFPYVYLTSNGTLSTIERVKPVLEAGIDSIRFSINAGTRESYKNTHGCDMFEQVIENVRAVAEYVKKHHPNVILSSSFVKTKKTDGEEKLLRELLKGYIDEIVVYEAHALEEISEEVRDTYEMDTPQPKRNGMCPRLFNTMYIDAKGMLDLCCASQIKKKSFVDLTKGDISLKDAWYCPQLTQFRKNILEGKTAGTVCEDCYMRNSTEDMFSFDLD